MKKLCICVCAENGGVKDEWIEVAIKIEWLKQSTDKIDGKNQ